MDSDRVRFVLASCLWTGVALLLLVACVKRELHFRAEAAQNAYCGAHVNQERISQAGDYCTYSMTGRIASALTPDKQPARINDVIITNRTGGMRRVVGQFPVDTPGQILGTTRTESQVTFDNGDTRTLSRQARLQTNTR